MDVGDHAATLVAALQRSGLVAALAGPHVEVEVHGDVQLDGLRDVIAELGLPLYQLTSRLTSLDDVFLRRAGENA